MPTRRDLLPLLVCLPAAARAHSSNPNKPSRFRALPARLAQLEGENGGRLGVAVLDTGSGERSGHRATERFPMCSTFKVLLAAAVMQRAERHQERLEREISIPAPPLLGHSPLTLPHAGRTMPIVELCQAAVQESDNTAANLLLAVLGGPAGVTGFARSLKDEVTRLDRTEPALNESLEGDPRDTTSPAAMAHDVNVLLLGKVLAEGSRGLLREWLEDSSTGLQCLRAKLPKGWRAADKTGRNGGHTTNDVAVLWPPDGPPLIVAAYLTQCAGPDERREALLAEIGRLVTTPG